MLTANLSQYWNHPDVWNERELNALDRDRIPKTLAMIPPDVNTILEVGCGNGRVSNMIARQYKVFGTDISRTALKQAAFSPLVSSADHLPFTDRAVDLIVCCDVLEHLPAAMLPNVMAEFRRISRRYLLIGVPYRECIPAAHLRCLDCGYVGHTFGHLWSWTESMLDDLVGLPFIKGSYAGQPRTYFNPHLLSIQQRLGQGYWAPSEPAVCHGCGGSRFGSGERTLAQKLIAKASFTLNAALDHVVPSYWKPKEEVIRLYAIPQ